MLIDRFSPASPVNGSMVQQCLTRISNDGLANVVVVVLVVVLVVVVPVVVVAVYKRRPTTTNYNT